MDTMTKLVPSTSRNDLWQVTLTKSRVAAHLGVTTSWKILKNYCVRIETESCKHIIYDIYRGSKMQRKAKSKGVFWTSSRDPHRSWEFQLVIFVHGKGDLPIISPATITALQDLSAEGSSDPVGEQPPVWRHAMHSEVRPSVPVVTWNAGMSCIGEPAELNLIQKHILRRLPRLAWMITTICHKSIM